jgi:endonuclease/exonuclease/phosphatase (EEP) superfamily protein YafD
VSGRAAGAVATRWYHLRPFGLLTAAATLASLASLAGSCEGLGWPLFFAVHFRLQYALCLGAAAALFALGRRRLPALVFGLFALWNAALVAPAWIAPAAPEGHGSAPACATLRVLHSNLLSRNRNVGAAQRMIRAERADVLVLQEVSLTWWRALEPLLEDYPYRKCEPREDNFGLALASKLPFESCAVRWFGEANPPSIVAELVTAAGPLHLIAIHPLSPQGPGPMQLCDEQLRLVADCVASLAGNVVLVGDLNTTPWAANFSELLAATGLRDSRRGFGNQATWPTMLWPLMIPLDHVLVSPRIEVLDRRLGPQIGSDHLPVIVDLRLRAAPAGAN